MKNEKIYGNNEQFISSTPMLNPSQMYFLQGFIDELYQRTPLYSFKALFSEVVKISNNNEQMDISLLEKMQQAFRSILSHVNSNLYHTDRFSSDQKIIVGDWMHQEFVSFCLLGTWPSRSLQKPQRIAGDHYTIKQIYSDGGQEKSSLGRAVNYCFFQEPACKAVKNRKRYIENKIMEKVLKNGNETTYVSSIACGPAEEIFNTYSLLGKENRQRLKVVGLDKDKRACASVDDRIQENYLTHYFSTSTADILKLTPPPSAMRQQDFVYSMGLIDYFKDRATVKIINILYEMLKPGGEIVIGNFHTSCDSRIFLDHLLKWKLIYRTEEDMRRLFSQSAFADSKVTVDFEPEGVNMLVRCIKQ
ncbi:methyltransferase domain-containing protein [Agarilytica rhodophyticola]|uniref:methyltransferase domain-containing protein n=1 Tax=Agarilytica rhodophyticola TaxID=1737490 RepID=UPI000B345ADC|nr:methyltransferase domain-containing protein [Agarilytica rhodophyticola]